MPLGEQLSPAAAQSAGTPCCPSPALPSSRPLLSGKLLGTELGYSCFTGMEKKIVFGG